VLKDGKNKIYRMFEKVIDYCYKFEGSFDGTFGRDLNGVGVKS